MEAQGKPQDFSEGLERFRHIEADMGRVAAVGPGAELNGIVGMKERHAGEDPAWFELFHPRRKDRDGIRQVFQDLGHGDEAKGARGDLGEEERVKDFGGVTRFAKDIRQHGPGATAKVQRPATGFGIGRHAGRHEFFEHGHIARTFKAVFMFAVARDLGLVGRMKGRVEEDEPAGRTAMIGLAL